MGTFSPNGAVAVVTGAGGGIGRGIALAFAKRGTTVIVADVEGDAAEQVAAELEADGHRAVAAEVDVTNYDDVAALADRAYEQFGKVDLLCNNAGVTMRPFRATWDGSDADFRWMMEINFFGVINGIRAFVPRMLEQTGRRHILNTASTAALEDVMGHSMYAGSKYALEGVSNNLRAELDDKGHDVGVTVLFPGAVTTRIATSERLRTESDRSSTRSFTPWVSSHPRTAPVNAMDPEEAGERAFAAVIANDRYCLTHPAPLAFLEQRVADLTNGYREPAR